MFAPPRPVSPQVFLANYSLAAVGSAFLTGLLCCYPPLVVIFGRSNLLDTICLTILATGLLMGAIGLAVHVIDAIWDLSGTRTVRVRKGMMALRR